MNKNTGSQDLLAALQKNRPSLKELAKTLDLPLSTVHAKIAKLEKDGIIKGYRAVLDEKKLGFPLTCFIFVSLAYPLEKENSTQKIARQISSLPNTQEIHLMQDEFEILIKLKARDTEDVGNFLAKLKEINGVGSAKASVAFGTVKETSELDASVNPGKLE